LAVAQNDVVGGDQITKLFWDELLTNSVLRSLATILLLRVTPSGAVGSFRAATNFAVWVLREVTQKMRARRGNASLALPRVVEGTSSCTLGGRRRDSHGIVGRDRKSLRSTNLARVVILPEPLVRALSYSHVQVPRGTFVHGLTIGECCL
jgi:hypothetical protein